MWRSSLTVFRKVIYPSLREKINISKILYSTNRPQKSTLRYTLISASVGVLAGAGYGGYTHYKINAKINGPIQKDEYLVLKTSPKYKPHYKVVNDADQSRLQIVLFQYRTCPFCCKVRAYLDYKGISYDVVEVDAVLRQDIKWSHYKKVPLMLVKTESGYLQLIDSTAIISLLETYLNDKSQTLMELTKYYPPSHYVNADGRNVTEVANRYFLMKQSFDKDTAEPENEERKWRRWSDNVLVHTLSPNVYRTPKEALDTFHWFADVGGWRENFPLWEVSLMVYGGAFAMWIISKGLRKRHNIPEDVRYSLYQTVNVWLKAINDKGTQFMGGDTPNMADISVYGILSSIEGCEAFADLKSHTKVAKWYDAVKVSIDRRKGRIIHLNDKNITATMLVN